MVCVCVHLSVCVELRQLREICPHRPLCKSPGLNSGSQAGQQRPYPPSRLWPVPSVFDGILLTHEKEQRV